MSVELNDGMGRNSAFKVIIVGGGIGGLTLAIVWRNWVLNLCFLKGMRILYGKLCRVVSVVVYSR